MICAINTVCILGPIHLLPLHLLEALSEIPLPGLFFAMDVMFISDTVGPDNSYYLGFFSLPPILKCHF
jgi:hypothetical protein